MEATCNVHSLLSANELKNNGGKPIAATSYS